MCFMPKKPKPLADPLAAPEKTADPQDVGAARKAEDNTLFGGVPDLRVDRSTTSGGAVDGGSGLNIM